MTYLHLHDIIHRDLKLDNILLDEFLFPKIADFGLSKSYNDQIKSMDNVVKASPIYIAPEIWQNSHYSKAADVYAFSIIAYQIITNETVFDDQNIYSIMFEVCQGNRPNFHKPIATSYINLIESCWSQNPLNRPSFDEILEKLRKDRGFITENIDETEFWNYVDYIEKSSIFFHSFKRNIHINERINVTTNSFNIVKNVLDKIHIPPYEYISKLDDECINIVLEAENDPKKQLMIAKYIINGQKRFPIDLQLAIEYLEKSIKSGQCIESTIYYCNLLIKGKIIPKNFKKARKIIENQLKDHKEEYTLLYGKLYTNEKDYSKAKNCFYELIEKESKDGMYEYGKMLQKGLGTEIDIEKSIIYYKMAIKKGSLKAMCRCGILLYKSENQDKKEEGFQYLKKAAEKGHTKSMYKYSLYLMKQNIKSFEDDEGEAYKYMTKAAENGHVKAIALYCAKNIQSRIEKGEDYDEFIRLLKTSCDRGYIQSISHYGYVIFANKGFPSNPRKAAKYIRIAAYNNMERFYGLYGYMLQFGIGVSIDMEEAFKFYQKGIESGDS